MFFQSTTKITYIETTNVLLNLLVGDDSLFDLNPFILKKNQKS